MTDRSSAHVDEFRANGGKLGGDFEDDDILLLHHRGARSGIERVTPLGYQRIEGGYAVFGTNYGRARHPAWAYNLIAHPETMIEVGTETLRVRARPSVGDERERIWARQVELVPAMAEYQRRARRTVRVVILEPI